MTLVWSIQVYFCSYLHDYTGWRLQICRSITQNSLSAYLCMVFSWIVTYTSASCLSYIRGSLRLALNYPQCICRAVCVSRKFHHLLSLAKFWSSKSFWLYGILDTIHINIDFEGGDFPSWHICTIPVAYSNQYIPGGGGGGGKP